jgi:hypothetical protein
VLLGVCSCCCCVAALERRGCVLWLLVQRSWWLLRQLVHFLAGNSMIMSMVFTAVSQVCSPLQI